jgi:protein SCO1/2
LALAGLLLVSLATIVAACGSTSGASDKSAESDDISTPLNGRDPKGFAAAVQQDPPTAKPSFTLPDTSGVPFDLGARTQGKLTLLYFGYTNCPDVCPATMAELSQGYNALPAADRAKIDVVFVTTDPERDTGPVLSAWLGKINKHFIGLTGTVDQTNAILESMGFPKIEKEKVGDGYAVTHIAFTYVYTSDNKSHIQFTDGVSPDRITHDLKKVVNGWSKGS